MHRRAVAALVAAAAAATLAAPAPARAEPSDRELFGFGVGLAIPTYFVGVTLHEGSHAVATKLMGGSVTQVHLWPGRNPYTGVFNFGWVRVQGLTTRAQRNTMLLAPKLTDLVLFGGWTALWATDNLPGNDWGEAALLVLATGFWVDFTKDVFVFHRHNDVVKVYASYGLQTEWQRLPPRLLHAAASVGLGWLLYRGYDHLFTGNDGASTARIVPVLSTTF